MTEQTPSQTKNLRKKLQKREQRILVRLKEAQQAQEKALERYHRAEERLQKRMARVQLIEGRLTLVRQQIDDLHVNPAVPSAETEIPTWAQFIPPSSTDEEKSGSILEPTVFIREARAAAEAAEENIRMAAARAAEISEVTHNFRLPLGRVGPVAVELHVRNVDFIVEHDLQQLGTRFKGDETENQPHAQQDEPP